MIDGPWCDVGGLAWREEMSGLTAASKLSAAMNAVSRVDSRVNPAQQQQPLTQHHVEEHHEQQQSADGSMSMSAAARSVYMLARSLHI